MRTRRTATGWMFPIGDSTIANGQYYSVFFVRAATTTPSAFYDSAADSGYSLDNLAPVRRPTSSSRPAVGGRPTRYVLSVSNCPNPFNPRTTVSYTVPSRGPVRVAVYDARGALVATLLDGAIRVPGAYAVDWSGRADDGAPVASGVYFVRIEHGGATRTKKMVVLK